MGNEITIAKLSSWFINIFLLLLFGVSHSLLASERIKKLFAFSLAVERSSYVLITSLVLIFLVLAWQPLPGTVWQLHSDSIIALGLNILSWLGWLIMFCSSFAVSHSDLFGLRQSWLQWKKQHYTEIPFQMRGFYRITRHPMMTGFLIAFWFTPNMTNGRLLFNVIMTLYIFIGIYFEEQKLLKTLGNEYRLYSEKIPMLIPWPIKVKK